jgi:seryl-tRNA synthetase
MLDINSIRKNTEEIKRAIQAKNVDPKIVDHFLTYDTQWRELTAKIDALRAEQKKAGDERDINRAKELKAEIAPAEEQLKELAQTRAEILDSIPNMPFGDVPRGKDETENKVVREVGKKPEFDFPVKDYLSLAEKLNLIDVEQSAKVSGSRFGYLKNEAVLLEFALVKLVFDTLLSEGFSPVVPPVMIKPENYQKMGRLAGAQKDERYYLPKDDLYLVGSSEHTIGPMHMDYTFEEGELPKRYIGFSTCFRKEAGSYGKDTKGILRVHQFDKVELFSFAHPEKSEDEHKFLLSCQEKLMQALELPYRVVEICTGDMGWTDARQFDIETWLPGQGTYRETNSCSNTTDFQARGINARHKTKEGSEYVHMLNGTGFAIGRMIIAILENGQTADGHIKVPKVLQAYLGKEVI